MRRGTAQFQQRQSLQERSRHSSETFTFRGPEAGNGDEEGNDDLGGAGHSSISSISKGSASVIKIVNNSADDQNRLSIQQNKQEEEYATFGQHADEATR